MIDFESHILDPAAPPATHCLHCGLPVPLSLLGHSEFCCGGCKNVYLFIESAGLDEFYELRERVSPGALGRRQESSEVSAHLDDPEFSRRYLSLQENGLQRIHFFLEGIHCAACVWLLERIPELCPGVARVTVNLTQARLIVEFNPSQIPLSRIAETISSLGYVAHPLRQDIEGDLRARAERTVLIRLGVAAVSAMNTMLLAVSLYQGWFTGMDPKILRFFTLFSLVLSLPAVLYSAIPFYRTAYAGLRQGVLHIDLPLSVAIVLGFCLSAWNTLQGNSQVYFDTVTALIFLLLGARFLQQRGLNASANRMSIFSALSPLWARRFRRGLAEEVYIESVVPGDLLEVRAGERFPVDGVLLSGATEIDQSLLTGESEWISVSAGHPVWGGTLNCQQTVNIEAKRSHGESRIGQLISQLEHAPNRGGQLIELADRLSGYFVVAVLVLAIGGGLYWSLTTGISEALSVVLALLVVSCPCALGLAAPLAYSSTLRGAAQNGIFVREARLLELLQSSRTVVFDKTGVLTDSEFSVTSIWIPDEEEYRRVSGENFLTVINPDLLAGLFTLETQSPHVLGRALVRFLRESGVTPLEPEMLSKTTSAYNGVSALVSGHEIAIGARDFLSQKGVPLPELSMISGVHSESLVYLAIDQSLVSIFGLEAKIREGSLELCRALRKSGRKLLILSGDRAAAVNAVAAQLEFEDSNVYSERSPEEKAEQIRSLEQEGPVVMIGDGANDTSALHAASIGIAASGAADAAVEVAGISISPFVPEKVLWLLSSIRRMSWLIRLNFTLSVIYNSFAATAALMGRVNPLVAAIIMPLSSFSVLFTTLWFPAWSVRRTKEGGQWK